MSTRAAISVGAILLLGNCPRGPTAPAELDREEEALQRRVRTLLDEERYAEARHDLSEALRRHAAQGDHAAAAGDATQLSQLHQTLNEFADAVRMADRARAEAALANDEAALAAALVALGETLARVGDHTRALEVYAEAAPHLPEREPATHARLAVYRALSLQAQGRPARAQDMLERARDLAREAGEHHLALAACVNLADIALSAGRLDEADRHLRDARAAQRLRDPGGVSPGALINEATLGRLRGDLAAASAALDRMPEGVPPDTAWWVALERGQIAEQGARLDDAEDHYRDAVGIVERQRAEAAPETTKAPFLEDRWDAYARLFALQVRMGDERGAFETMAQAQGRMFLDALTVSLAETARSTPSRIDGAIGRIDLLEQVVPPLAGSQLGATRSLQATLAALRGRHILAYFAAGGRLRMMTVVDGEPRATSVDVDLRELDELIDDFRSGPHRLEPADALGRALLPPEVLPALGGRFHIVPTGPLVRVSFAALRVAGERVLDRYEIVYAPSVTGLAAMVSEGVQPSGAGLVVADTRSDLAHARAESEIVVEQTGATARVGSQATGEALREAARLPLLHVVSHSGLGERGGYLALADGEVTAADILTWRIRPALVVLPTCSSAATHRSEMWDSLAAAFLAAGSRHVVATVASVEDSVALEFTRLFYRELHAGDPVAAVTRALRQMAGRHPVDAWSAFVIAGL